MKDKFKDPLKPKHIEHRNTYRHHERNESGNMVNTLVGGLVAVSLIKAIAD